MKFSLMVGEGPHKGKLIPINKAPFVIGRDPSCQLRPASMTISKRHCELLIRDDKFFIKDLQSTNGTVLNDLPLKGEKEVQHGDQLKLGPLTFTVNIDGAAEANKATAVDTNTARVPEKGKSVKPAGQPDEESVAWMLLQLGEPDKQAGGEVEAGSTEFFKAAAVEDLGITRQIRPDAPYRPATEVQQGASNNSAAAKDILEKYRRRPKV